MAIYHLKKIWTVLKALFPSQSKSSYRVQTFTYYIPAPPPRKSGYREKEFDKFFYSFINLGYEILSINVQSHSGPQSSGMWVLLCVRALNEKADALDLELNPYAPSTISNPAQNSMIHSSQSSEDEIYYFDPDADTEEEDFHIRPNRK